MSRALPARTLAPLRARRGTARAVAVAGAVALALTGCGSGLQAQTYQARTLADATNDAVGSIAIRNLRVLPPRNTEAVYPVGADARVGGTFVNVGDEPDRLVSVTSDAATRVAVVGPDGRPAELVVPAQGVTADRGFVLLGLTREVRPGLYVELELTFERGGTETLLVPVELTGLPAERREGYRVAETDSEGVPLVEEEEGEEIEGEESGPELDADGGDLGDGDAEPLLESEPEGDGNGGDDAVEPPTGG